MKEAQAVGLSSRCAELANAGNIEGWVAVDCCNCHTAGYRDGSRRSMVWDFRRDGQTFISMRFKRMSHVHRIAVSEEN
jgi:hypothetical protein